MDARKAGGLRRRLAATPRKTVGALLALLLVGAPASAAAADKRAPTRFHLDCSAAGDGEGSRGRPWSTLERASAAWLRPGARLLIRRGTECAGVLAPHGSGSHGRPAIIGAYGSGPRPRIEGEGEDAVVLRDMSYVVLQDLEVTNHGDFESRRRGVHVVAERGVVRDVTLRRLHVHDVEGDLAKDANGSGGIQIDVLGGPPARFDRVLIERNRIEDVSRSGIFIVGTADGTRPRAFEPWPEASKGVVVRRNRLTRLAGDGIVPTGTAGALVEENVVSEGNLSGRGFADPRGLICNAGIWTFHANRTVIQRNEVFDMRFNGCDGTAYDVDYDQDGTIVQFNYSHDNEGGFILLCTDAEPRAADVRFNLSVDDRFLLYQSPCSLRPGATFEGLRVYNNTAVARDPALAILGTRATALLDPAGLEFRNNVVYATVTQGSPLTCGARCSHNLFWGLPPSGTSAVAGDPRFRHPARRGLGRLAVGRGFRLGAGSPAIGAGTPMSGSPRADYFGKRVTDPPAIGFHQRR
jgi:hypothetical protein